MAVKKRGELTTVAATKKAKMFDLKKLKDYTDSLDTEQIEDITRHHRFFNLYKKEKVITLNMLYFLYMYERDFTQLSACEKVGVSKELIYHYTKTNPVFNFLYNSIKQHAEETMLDIAEAKLMENIRSGKENSIFFFLERRGRERGYSRTDINPEFVVEDIVFEEIKEDDIIEVEEEENE